MAAYSFKESFSNQNSLKKLIIINVAVFIFLKILHLFLFLFDANKEVYFSIIKYLAVPANLTILAERPWTILSYMFVHNDFFHLLFNMLLLFWFGSIFCEYLGNKKLVSNYILGGLAGAGLYILSFNIFPGFKNIVEYSYAVGASAGILSIVISTATLLPNYTLSFFLIGPVPLKYIAVFAVIVDLLSITEGNAGGHIAHLGGALFGFFYVKRLKKGKDLAKGFENMSDKIKSLFSFSSKKMRIEYRRPPKSDEEFLTEKKQKQKIIDDILDKIAQSGYESLSKEEKETLFKISRED